MAGTYNSDRGISWQQAWTLLHTARTDAERNTWEELFFDGRDTPGNVNLLGQAAVTRIPDIHKLGGTEIALTGQAATASKGNAVGKETFEFVVDSFTDTNSTAITSHTGELGATWTDVGAGTVATIQSNRLRPAADSTGVNMYTASGTPSDADYAVAADIYMIAWNGNAAWQYLDVGVMARYSATGGGEAYAFGWDAYFGGWALYKLYAGSWGMISINQSYDSTRTAGDARTIELFVEGTTNPRLRGWVNGVLVQEYTDTYQQITSTGVAGVVMCNQEINFAIDRVVFDNTVPSKEQLTGQVAQARQQRFFDLYDNTTYPNDLFVDDTFTDTDGQWLYSHTGETGATWSIIEDTASWPAFITSNKVQTPNDTGITKWQASGTPGVFGADYAVQADLYAPTTNYSFNGIGARWAFDTVMRGYALCLTREWSAGVMYWQLRQYDNGWNDLGQSTTNVPAAGTSARARIEVSGTGSHVFIRCYADGDLILSVVDKSTSRITNAYQAGIAYQLASANWDVVDNFTAGWPSLLPPGQVALTGFSSTTAAGSVTPESRLVGYAGTTGYGALKAVIDVVPLGQVANTDYGDIVGAPAGNVEVGLNGYAATTGYGQLGLEFIQLFGQAATTSSGTLVNEFGPALLGWDAVAQGGYLGVDNAFLLDTFTDSTNKDLSAHTGERGATWTVAQQTTADFKFWLAESSDDVSPSWPSGTLGTAYYRASGTAPSADYSVEVYYTASKNTGGAAGYITEGVVARMNSGATAGYIFGRNPYDGLWQIDKIGTGAVASAATGTLGSYQVYKLRIQVTGGATTVIKGFVDDVEVVSYSDSSSPVTATGYAGLHHRIASTAGYPYEYPSGYFDTIRALPAGDAVTVRPYGRRITTAQAALDPTLRLGQPSGQVATTAQGALGPAIILGTGASPALAPAFVAVGLDETTANNLSYSASALLPIGNVYVGVGEKGDPGISDIHKRHGVWRVDANTQTITYTNGSISGTVDDLDTDVPYMSFANHFPRSQSEDSSTYPYTDGDNNIRGWLSADRDGNFQTAHVRKFKTLGAYGGHYNTNTGFTTYYIAWQQGPWDFYTNPYVGPEFLVATVGDNAEDYERYHVGAAGLYAVAINKAIAFYTKPVHSGLASGVRLYGHKAILEQGIPAKEVESTGCDLTGLAATARGGVSTGTPFPNANDAAAVLTGLRLTTPTLGYNLMLTPTNSQTNAMLAYRYLRDGAWSAEVVLSSFTGLTQVHTIPGSICTTHSGYGDTIYVTYFASERAGGALDIYAQLVPAYVGLVVMDAVTEVVHSHVLTALTDTPYAYWSSSTWANGERDRRQGEVVTLSNGTSITQYQQKRHILRLSWTYATRTAPTLTVKDGPVVTGTATGDRVIREWESLEVRGDSVYHVLYGKQYDYNTYPFEPVVAWINDATGTGSTWTKVQPSSSGALRSASSATYTDFHSGYGGGNRSYIHETLWQFDTAYYAESNERYVNFWSGQTLAFSVSTAGRVGRVGVVVSRNADATLTGEAATTAYGTLTPDLTIRRQLTGLSATTNVGQLIDVVVPLTGLSATASKGTITIAGTGGEFFAGLVTAGIHRAFTQGGILGNTNGNTEGQVAVATPGVLGLSVDQYTALEGQGLVTAINNDLHVATVSPPISGQGATATAGVSTAQLGSTLVSVRLEAAQGVPVVTRENISALTGQQCSLTQGALSRGTDQGAVPLGRGATCAKGNVQTVVTVDANTPPLGLSVATATGQLVPLVVTTPLGRTAVTSAGTLQLLLNIFLTGRQGVLVQGAPTYSYGSTAMVGGVYSKGELGEVWPSFPRLRQDAYLWVRSDTERIFVVQKPEEEIADAPPLI